MDELALLVLAVLGFAGVTLILTRGWIFLPFRVRFEGRPIAHRFVRCPLCVGFWTGAAGWTALELVINTPLSFFLLIEILLVGGAVSFLATWAGGADETVKG